MTLKGESGVVTHPQTSKSTRRPRIIFPSASPTLYTPEPI
jgi:hypothetical protein